MARKPPHQPLSEWRVQQNRLALARLNKALPAIFPALQQVGGISPDEMWRTFNMGIGMVLVARQADTTELVRALDGTGAAVIGMVVANPGPERVRLV